MKLPPVKYRLYETEKFCGGRRTDGATASSRKDQLGMCSLRPVIQSCVPVEPFGRQSDKAKIKFVEYLGEPR